jgi:hypothetical protein
VKKLGKKTYKRTRFSTKKRKVWELIMNQIIKEFPSLIHFQIFTKDKEILMKEIFSMTDITNKDCFPTHMITPNLKSSIKDLQSHYN